MFIWTGVLDRAAYLRRAAATIAFLIGTILLFPFLTKAIVSGSHCAVDTCGVVGLAAAVLLRPLFFIAAMAMALNACVRRARDAGLNPWLGAFPPFMLIGDQTFLQYAGAGWAYPFSAGILAINPPVYALFGTALIGLLAIPSRDSLRGAGSPWLDEMIVILAALLSVAAVLRAGGFPLFAFTALPPLVTFGVVTFSTYAAYAMPLFLALAAYRLWQSPRLASIAPSPAAAMTAPAAATPSPAVIAAPETLRLWRPGRAAAIGAAIAFAVLLWSLLANSQTNSALLPIALLTFLMPAFVPTFFLYTPLVATAMRFAARRDAIGAAALVAALIPFGFWAASLSSVRMAKAREAEAVAAIPKVALPATIGGVVIEGDDWPMINCARVRILSGDYAVGDVLTRQGKKSSYLRFTRATAKAPVRKGMEVDAAPAEYVLIRFPRRPSFFADRVSVDIVSPPAEIYAVDAAGTRLVAATYTALNPAPAFPPMLMSQGWYREDTSTTSEKSCRNVGAFIQRELLDKLPPRQS